MIPPPLLSFLALLPAMVLLPAMGALEADPANVWRPRPLSALSDAPVRGSPPAARPFPRRDGGRFRPLRAPPLRSSGAYSFQDARPRPPDYAGPYGSDDGGGGGGGGYEDGGGYEGYGRDPNLGRRGTFDSDNAVDGLPIVTCGSDEMGIVVKTDRPFLGRIFVKGQSKRRECVREFLNNTVPEGALQIPLSSCGMTRERKLAPSPGLEESVTIVVSFHYVFVTASDRAYKVICLYGQENTANTISVVTHGLNISHIPTVAVTPASAQSAANPPDCSYEIRRGGGTGPFALYAESAANPPDCSYEIRRGGGTGPFALYAEVGDVLFHRWTCEGPNNLRILVKSCLVSDGEGEMFVVIDDRGCAVDPAILPDLAYDGNTAYVEAQAFKFADTNFLGFSCTIQVCSQYESCRDISPPACSVDGFRNVQLQNGAYDKKRLSNSARVAVLKDEVDVSAPALSVLDSRMYARPAELAPIVEKTRPGGAGAFSVGGPHGLVLEGRRHEGWQVAAARAEDTLCLGKFWLGLGAIAVGGLLLCAATAAALLAFKARSASYRRRRRKA